MLIIGMTKCVGPDHTAPLEEFNLGLCCLMCHSVRKLGVENFRTNKKVQCRLTWSVPDDICLK